MRKTLLFCTLAMYALISCSDDENPVSEPQKPLLPQVKGDTIPSYPLLPGMSYDPRKPDSREPLAELENGMKLVWNDEFNEPEGTRPDDAKWTYERGMIRNNESQCYTDKNAACDGYGNMVIEGRVERVLNPMYKPGGTNWNEKQEYADYTSASLTTQNKFAFTYGQVIVRAKIPTNTGAWPALWTLGTKYDWPSNGELDIMEFYINNGTPSIWANACWASDQAWVGQWNSRAIPFQHFRENDPEWTEKYHIWREEWDENSIKIYLDDELLNNIDITGITNGKNIGTGGEGENPFRHEHYFLMNLALGAKGGALHNPEFPLHYYIDYVRIYQKPK